MNERAEAFVAHLSNVYRTSNFCARSPWWRLSLALSRPDFDLEYLGAAQWWLQMCLLFRRFQFRPFSELLGHRLGSGKANILVGRGFVVCSARVNVVHKKISVCSRSSTSFKKFVWRVAWKMSRFFMSQSLVHVSEKSEQDLTCFCGRESWVDFDFCLPWRFWTRSENCSHWIDPRLLCTVLRDV